MFDTDIESSDAIFFNKNFFGQHLLTFVDSRTNWKNEKIAIFPNFKENSK